MPADGRLHVKKISYPERHFLEAAIGWLQLGNAAESRAELARITGPVWHHPEVIEVRCSLDAHERDWPAALALAEELVRIAPERSAGYINRSYALHELQRTAEALAALHPARERFPKDHVIPYNLACYCCQLGRLDEARDWLRQAQSVGDKEAVLAMARADSDLKSLWPELAAWRRPGGGGGRAAA